MIGVVGLSSVAGETCFGYGTLVDKVLTLLLALGAGVLEVLQELVRQGRHIV